MTRFQATIPSAGGGPTAITVQDEGVQISDVVDTLNFVGSGVKATGSGDVIAINIPGFLADLLANRAAASDPATLNMIFWGTDNSILYYSDGSSWTTFRFALANLANIADQRILGNISGGAAAPSALTTAQFLSFLGVLPIANGGTNASSAASALTNLGALPIAGGTMTGTLVLNADATTGLQPVSYQQWQAALTGFDSKPDADYAATSALPTNNYSNGTLGVGATLTGTANGPLVIDGVTILVGQVGRRVLVAGESTGSHNGWYDITQVGVVAVSPYILTRSTTSDQAAEIGPGYLTSVIAPAGGTPGTNNNGKVFLSSAPVPFVVGTDAVTFSSVGNTYSAGTGLSLSGTTFSIDTSITVDKTTAQVLTNKTLTTPTIGDFTNATHNHTNAAGGGQLTDAALSAAVGIAKGGTGQTTQTAGFNALDPLTTKGDIIVNNGTDSIRVAVGSNTQVLTADSTAASGVKWGAAASGTLVYQAKTSNYTVLTTDDVMVGNAGAGGAFTFTLPDATTATAKMYYFKKSSADASTNTITIATVSAQTIDGASSIALITTSDAVTLFPDGTNWRIF